MRKFYLVAIVIIAIEQNTKWFIIKQKELRESIPIIENFFYITSHRNKGAAWGILQDQILFFYIITVIVVIGIIYYMEKHLRDNKFMAFAFIIILGGAIVICIDKLFIKVDVDFLDVYIFV